MLLLAATLAIIALAIVNFISNSIITKAGVVFEMAWQETEIILYQHVVSVFLLV